MKIIITIIILLFFPVYGVCILYAGENRVVSVVGMGVITGGNNAVARDSAVEDALRKAVEQSVGLMVSSESVVENYQLISDNIYTKARGYIKRYNVVSEGAEGNIYRVKVEADVAKEILRNDLDALGILMSRKNRPRMMIMMAEQNIGQQGFSFWWGPMQEEANLSAAENTIIEKFSSKGFEFVDRSGTDKNISISKAHKVVNPANDAVKIIGKKFGAEVVIVGKALAKYVGNIAGSSMKSCQANVSARALRTDTGEVIASATTQAAAVHIDEATGGTEAIKKASGKLSDEMMDQIIRKWGSEVSGGSIVQVVAGNIEDFRDLVQFKQKLKSGIREVKAVYQRNFAGHTAVIDVEMKGNAQLLADKMIMQEYDGFKIKVRGFSANKLDIVFEKK